jgi:hypothetical protein
VPGVRAGNLCKASDFVDLQGFKTASESPVTSSDMFAFVISQRFPGVHILFQRRNVHALFPALFLPPGSDKWFWVVFIASVNRIPAKEGN